MRAGAGGYAPLEASRDVLRSLRAEEVYVVRWEGNALPPQYFVNMMPADCNIRLDAETNRFFNDQDFDEAVKNARKPFLRDAKDCRRYNKQEV